MANQLSIKKKFPSKVLTMASLWRDSILSIFAIYVVYIPWQYKSFPYKRHFFLLSCRKLWDVLYKLNKAQEMSGLDCQSTILSPWKCSFCNIFSGLWHYVMNYDKNTLYDVIKEVCEDVIENKDVFWSFFIYTIYKRAH